MPLTRRGFLGTAALGLTACAAPAPAAPASGAGPIADAGGLVDWIVAHPADAAVLVDDGRGATVRHRADRPRPIASAVKVVHLVAYARAVADGRLDPAGPVAVRDWERWYVPGADGGAHTAALEMLGTTPEGTVTWDDVVAVMIDVSDNAAADLLLATLGADALTAAAAAGGWSPLDVPHLAGEALYVLAPEAPGERRDAARALGEAWARGEPEARALGEQYAAGVPGGGAGAAGAPADDAAAPVDDAAAPVDDAVWRAAVDAWEGSWAASAEQLAAVHRAAATGALPPGVAATVRRHLERAVADRLPGGVLGLGQKGGSLPGTVTWAGTLRRADGTVGVAALTVSRLPQQRYTEVLTSGASVLLGQQALLDPAVTTRLADARGG